MPLWSSNPALVSCVGCSSTAAQACCPWWIGAAGDRLGESSPNKLEGRSDLVKMGMIFPCFLCHHGGGREDVGESSPCSTVASEADFRQRIQSRYSCSVSSSSSTMRCAAATAPTEACRLLLLAAGGGCSIVDYSGRRAASWSVGVFGRCLLLFLPAMVLFGRQIGVESASVSSSSGGCRRRSDGEASIPSGVIPGDGFFGPISKPRSGWTTLQFTACVRGLLCKVLGLSWNFAFLRDPCNSCTVWQKM